MFKKSEPQPLPLGTMHVLRATHEGKARREIEGNVALPVHSGCFSAWPHSSKPAAGMAIWIPMNRFVSKAHNSWNISYRDAWTPFFTLPDTRGWRSPSTHPGQVLDVYLFVCALPSPVIWHHHGETRAESASGLGGIKPGFVPRSLFAPPWGHRCPSPSLAAWLLPLAGLSRSQPQWGLESGGPYDWTRMHRVWTCALGGPRLW